MTTAAFVRTAAAAAVLALPGVASAADHAAGGAANVLEPNLVNSIVTLIVFLGLLAVLYKFAWGPILQGLNAREAAQFRAITEAEEAKKAAADLRTQVQAEMDRAARQVKDLLDDARKQADELRTAEREAGAKEASAERDRARREIEAAKQTALAEIHQQAVDLAALMSAKAIGRQITADDHRRLLDESLAELKHAVRA